MKFKIILATIMLSLCSVACAQDTSPLPNQPAIASQENGVRSLKGWSDAGGLSQIILERQRPNNTAFSGAELWKATTTHRDLETAIERSFGQTEMKNPKIIAVTDLNPDAIDVLDSDPAAYGAAVMLSGKISGQDARAIALVMHGSTSSDAATTTVHTFMAPKDKFVALGGFSIVAAKWLQASAAPDEDMSIEGSLPDQLATNRLALFFNKWVELYLIPMMGLTMQVQQQSIEQMQSWNTAMTTCAGDSSCSVVEDGFGGWTSVHQ